MNDARAERLFLLIALWRSRCRRSRRCLSSLISPSLNVYVKPDYVLQCQLQKLLFYVKRSSARGLDYK